MVSNIRQLTGVVSVQANAREKAMIVTYNSDTLAVEEIVAQIETGGDDVADWTPQP